MANEEARKVIQSDIRESNKIIAKLKEEGRHFGIDGNYPELKAIEEEGKRRIREIQRKYYSEKFND